MQAIILGSAAGGGIPQWNCRCPVCRLAWSGDPRVRPRTQSSLAVSLDGEEWLILNASPDIRHQIASTAALQPCGGSLPHGRGGEGSGGSRHSPIAAVLVTNGDVDHIAGLLSLRERQAFTLYGTAQTLRVIEANRIFDVMDHEVVARRAIGLGEPSEVLPGLVAELFAVPGKVPLWLEDGVPEVGGESESTVGVLLRGNGKRIAYVPGCARLSESVASMVEGADVLFFDGTLWRDDEMIANSLGAKTGRRMGHMPVSGADGSISALADARIGRRVFIHINNTNPMLIEGSPERRAAEAAGWTVGEDGMTVTP